MVNRRMMNRIGMMFGAAVLALGGIAQAGPAAPGDRYDLFGADYARVIAKATALSANIDAGTNDPAALDAFGDGMAALAKRLDREGGPHDLACIYRGIVKDLEKKRRDLARARDEASRTSARIALSAMLADAALVTPAPPEG